MIYHLNLDCCNFTFPVSMRMPEEESVRMSVKMALRLLVGMLLKMPVGMPLWMPLRMSMRKCHWECLIFLWPLVWSGNNWTRNWNMYSKNVTCLQHSLQKTPRLGQKNLCLSEHRVCYLFTFIWLTCAVDVETASCMWEGTEWWNILILTLKEAEFGLWRKIRNHYSTMQCW